MRTVAGVLVDCVNIGGNETGQQSSFASKGTRRRTLSGPSIDIVITDVRAASRHRPAGRACRCSHRHGILFLFLPFGIAETRSALRLCRLSYPIARDLPKSFTRAK
jgi:hypothetical protein